MYPWDSSSDGSCLAIRLECSRSCWRDLELFEWVSVLCTATESLNGGCSDKTLRVIRICMCLKRKVCQKVSSVDSRERQPLTMS